MFASIKVVSVLSGKSIAVAVDAHNPSDIADAMPKLV